MLFRHILPVAARHVAELLFRIHPLMDTYSLEISTPQFLEQEIVLAQQFFAKLPRFEIERQGCFILESDT